MGQKIGKSVSLKRSVDADIADTRTGFLLTNFPALYMGDLNLYIVEGKFRLVLSIHVEDYLLGVIPYEMGESFPIEALKAQAVAARTYALRSQGQYEDYDLLDNTNDQAFKGYAVGNTRSEKAVEETRGICGFYKGRLAQCYYSASNGGQTELVQTVWNSREPFAYYASVKDPYDIANPESVVRRFKLSKQYSEKKEAPERLKQLVFEYLPESLTDHIEVLPEDFRVDAVNAVNVDEPSSPDSLHMTNLNMVLSISLCTAQNPLFIAIDTSPEEVYLFEEPDSEKTNTSSQSSSEEQFFIPLSYPVAVTIPIFPVAEEALSLSISSNYQNEIWSVVETEDEFLIEVRRYGHGVGMSQRGAQWMAAKHNKTYQDILAFYYPEMELIRFPEQERRYTSADNALTVTAGPAPSPTPRPTVMPLSMVPSKGQWIAAVTGIADDSSLNLRSEPSLNSDILMRLYKGQRLLVLERCEEGWVHVQTDAAEGYVLESYLSAEH